MNKVLNIVIILIVLIVLLTTQVKAVDKSSLTIEIADSAKIGDTIKVLVKVKGNEEGIKGVQADLKYDKSILEYVDSKILNKKWFVSGFGRETGSFLLELTNILDTTGYIHDEVSLVEFNFKVKDTANIGKTTIKIRNILLDGANEIESTSVSKDVNIVNSSNTSQDSSNDNNTDGTNNENNNNSSSNGNDDQNSTTNNNDTSGTNNENNNSSSSNDNNNNNEKKDTTVISKSKLPTTGITNTLVLVTIAITMISILLYKKYKNLIDI